ncbi:MAG: type II/IV secretion system ATPase subunit [Candidatus Syntropharchaeia archaeon]
MKLIKRRCRRSIENYKPEKHGELVEFEGIDGFDEVERYWVNEGCALVAILYDRRRKINTYHVIEPSLTLFEKELLERLHEDLREVLTLEKVENENAPKEDILKENILELLDLYSVELESHSIYKLLYYLNRNYNGFEKIDPLMRDPQIEDISCDGVGIPIFLYHRKYHNVETNVRFNDEESLNSFVVKLAQKGGKHISVGEPLVDATLPDGSRLQSTFGREVTTRGASFTIRKFREDPFTPVDLLKFGTFSVGMLAYLWLAIENKKNLIFAGGTASGKTSSLNAISMFIPPLSKVISIEDTREITLYHDNWIASVTRDPITRGGEGEVTMFELLKAALRQRPEYIILGEVRGKEALTLFQAMSTGHTTYSTMHADSPQTVVNRLENEPINVPPVMLQALDIISVQIQTTVRGKRIRRTNILVEITGIDPRTNNLRINEMFKWNSAEDVFFESRSSHVLSTIAAHQGWSQKELLEELENRKKVLNYLLENDISYYKDVTSIIQSYFLDPGEIMDFIERNSKKAMKEEIMV